MRDFSVRYGVNLLDYNDDTSYQGTFTSCVAYWRGADGTLVTATATLDEVGYNGNDIRIPLDLTDKFESEPTEANLQTEALNYMRRNQTSLPAQSITVNFVRLADMGEYSAFQDLLTCKLCDTVNVIFPMYNVEAPFKIVRTEWDVIRGKYISMELGTLSTTLAEALGISETLDGSGPAYTDYVVDQGTSGIWAYRKWNSGVAECWGIATASITSWTTWGQMKYGTPYTNYNYPSGLFKSGTFPVVNANGGTTTGITSGDIFGAGFGGITADTGTHEHTPKIFLTRPDSGGTGSYAIFIHAIGVWK